METGNGNVRLDVGKAHDASGVSADGRFWCVVATSDTASVFECTRRQGRVSFSTEDAYQEGSVNIRMKTTTSRERQRPENDNVPRTTTRTTTRTRTAGNDNGRERQRPGTTTAGNSNEGTTTVD